MDSLLVLFDKQKVLRVSLSSFKIIPANDPVITATQIHRRTSAIVNLEPSIPKVRRIAVTVVAGVEMRNASVDALDAP